MLNFAASPLPCLTSDAAGALPLYPVAPAGLPGLLASLPAAAAAFLAATGFAAKAQQIQLLPGEDGLGGAVLGLGDAAPTPHAFGALPWGLPAGTRWRLEAAAALHPTATLGWCLGAYRYAGGKPAERGPATLLVPAGGASALAAARATWRVRDLINTPANLLGPAELAAAVAAVASEHGATFREVNGAELAAGFPAVRAVGQAAAPGREPRVAMLEWAAPGTDAGAPLVALCGKGVCFDTGGLDLKPSGPMLRMKKDMGGAAVALGLAELLMQAGLPIRLLLLVGAVENSVSGASFRPGDVIATRAGLRVEIGNTDAEGRLVLADLLAFAVERQPALLLDFATLTGAARVALGPDLPALFANDDSLAEALLRAGADTSDHLWRLPLHSAYDSWLESAVADINNVASKPMAGAVVAALFLRRFVPDGVRWGHVDLYAWNDSTRPGRPEGGEAQAMRAMATAIGRLYGSGSFSDPSAEGASPGG
jgi:leucyl aminopeptidase